MAGCISAGGSLAVVDLLNRYGGPIEADLARYYGVDIRDALRRPVPARRPAHDAVRHRHAPYVVGALVGVLTGLLVVAPVVACVLVVMLAVAAPFAWTYERGPALTGHALTPRRVLALVQQLPHDSATVAAVRGGDKFRGWDADRYLLALVADLLQELIYVQVSKSSKRKPQRPTPVPRPDDHSPAKSREGHGLRGQLQDMLRHKRNRKALS